MNTRPMPSGPDYVADAVALGVDEVMIDRLVRHFYASVRLDAALGPIFAARIADWEPHLRRMSDFWSSVMLRTGRYHGQPMPMHARMPVDASHFDRWLELFGASARSVCGRAAPLFIDRANRIAQSLELGIAGARGHMLRTDERLPALHATEERTPHEHDT